ERTGLAAGYRHIESAHGKAAADRWLNEQAQLAAPRAERFKAELSGPQRPEAQSAAPDTSAKRPAAPTESEHAVPAQDPRDPPDAIRKEAHAAEPTDEERLARRKQLRRNVDADADKLDRDYDPDQKPGHPSRIKRGFALLKYLDDPAFDEVAREFAYDPARLRAIARLLIAEPGDYDVVIDGLQDENGPIRDSAFFALYNGHLRSLIGAGISPDSKAMPSDDRRISAVLHLLGHDLSSFARGNLARNTDVNSGPLGQMLQAALEELGLPPEIAALAAIGGRGYPSTMRANKKPKG
ncbi:MAG: hypothetical protein JNM29_08455, partial [Candidatus Odyssella sp.]|nr:hypothetical protein [Candidatus Odyssella sp.]